MAEKIRCKICGASPDTVRVAGGICDDCINEMMVPRG